MKALVALAAAGLLPGCLDDHGCHAIGYTTGFSIALDSAAVPGAYQIQIDADGQLLLIDYTVDPDNRVHCFEGCRDERDNVVATPDRSSVSSLSGNWFPFYVYRLDEPAGPDELDVAIFRDQQMVFAQHYVPAYVTSEPNGPGCGKWTRAAAEITLPPP